MSNTCKHNHANNPVVDNILVCKGCGIRLGEVVRSASIPVQVILEALNWSPLDDMLRHGQKSTSAANRPTEVLKEGYKYRLNREDLRIVPDKEASDEKWEVFEVVKRDKESK